MSGCLVTGPAYKLKDGVVAVVEVAWCECYVCVNGCCLLINVGMITICIADDCKQAFDEGNFLKGFVDSSMECLDRTRRESFNWQVHAFRC